jgi:uncharacterized membrane protein YgcG
MGKVVMVISVAVTAFVLTITAGAVYNYRNQAAAAVANQPAAQPTSVVQMVVAAPAVAAAPPEVANVSPQDAASIAAKFLNRTDLYSVELADLEGKQSYKVTFTSGDIVFVGLNGQVLASTPPPPAAVVASSGGGGGGGHHHGGGGSSNTGGGGGGGGGDGGGEHEGGGD